MHTSSAGKKEFKHFQGAGKKPATPRKKYHAYNTSREKKFLVHTKVTKTTVPALNH